MAYSEELAVRLRAALRRSRGVQEKKMFGGIGFLVNGNMACGVHGQNLILRLGSTEYDTALKRPHVKVFDMSGRPMRGWVFVEKAGYASEDALHSWIEKSLTYARSLPPK